MGQVFRYNEYTGQVTRDENEINSQFLGYVGEDRGARIKIADSHFKHSRFCKGMLYYMHTKPVSFEAQS